MKELAKKQLNIENAKKLYNALIEKGGYDSDFLGDEDYFVNSLKDKGNRDILWDEVVYRGDFNIGSRDWYENRLTEPTKPTKSYIDDAPQDVKHQVASKVASKAQVGTPFKPQGKSEVISNMLGRSREVIGGMQDAVIKTRRMAENAPTNPQGRQMAKAYEMQRQMTGQSKPMGLSNWGAKQSQGGKQDGPQPKSIQSPQPYGTVMEDGERKQQWLLSDGTVTTDMLKADAAETQARGARLQHEFTRRMQGNGLDPAKSEDIKRQQELDMRDELKRQLDKQAEANKEARMDNAKAKNDAYSLWRKEHPYLSAVLSILNDGDAGIADDALAIDGKQDIIDTEKALDTEADLINQTRQKFDVANNGGGESLLKGLRNPWLREGTYSFGASDLRNMMALSKAQRKQQRGEQLTDTEQRLMTTAGISSAADELLDKDISAWYSIGEVASESIPFMAEMAANPLSGTGSAIAKYASKRLGLEGVKQLTRKQLMTKVAARTLGDVAGAMGMTATTGSLGVLADAERRRMGDVVPEYDQSGKVVGAKFEGGESYGTALAKAFGARTIENWSEMVGEYFSPVLKAAGSTVNKGLRKIKLGDVVDWATNVSNSAIARQIGNFESRVKFNGTIGEWAEEQVGTAANALLVGDSDWSDLVDARQQSITFGGVALMGGTISAIKAAAYPFGRRSAKTKLNDANEKGAAVYGERWNDIVTQFDEGKFEDVFPEMMQQAKTYEEKEAIVDYGRRLQTWRGYNIIEEKRRIEGIESVESDMSDNFDWGADTDINDTNTLSQILHDYEDKMTAFEEAFGAEPSAFFADDENGDYTGQLIRMKNAGQLTEEQATAAIDYLNAKAKLEGANYSFKEGLEAVTLKVRQDIRSNANRNGNVIKGTTKVGGNEVYVIGGNISADSEGNIDLTNSDTDIIIKLADTGEMQYASINDLSTAVVIGNAQQLITAAEANATSEYERKKALFESGQVDTTPGSTFTIRDDSGNELNVTVQGEAEGGKINVTLEDGTPLIFGADELQAGFDRYNWSRVSQQETVDAAIRYAIEQDSKQLQEEKTEHPFGIGSNVRVIGANGGEYNGVITEEDADGYTVELQDGDGNTVSIVRKTADELAAMQPQEESENTNTEQPTVTTDAEQTAAENPIQPTVATDTEQPSALARVPVDEQGAPKFDEADPETAYDAIAELMDGNEEDRDDLISKTIANLTKLIGEAEKKVGKVKLVGNDYAKFKAEKAAARQLLAVLQKQLERWNAIAGIGQQRAEAAAAEIKRQEEERKAEEEAERLRDASRMKISEIENQLGTPMDMYDYVMRAIGTGAYKFKWGDSKRTTHNTRGLGAHIGLKGSNDERKRRISFLDNNNGYYPEDAALKMLEDYTGNDKESYTDQDVFNIILDVLTQYDTPRAIMEAVFKRNNGGVDIKAEQDKWYEEQAMIEQDRIEAMLAQTLKELDEAATESEINGIFEDAIIQRNEYDYGHTGTGETGGVHTEVSTGEERDGGIPQGTELLPRQEADQHKGGEESSTGGYGVDAENADGSTRADASRVDADGGRGVGERIASAEADVDTEPTDKQKEAGNYKKGHVKIGSFDVTIENPKGSVRSGVDSNGERWSNTMNNTYGYIRGAISVDGDHIDVYLSNDIDNWNGEKVYVIDVYNPDGSFDEHKVMLGFNEVTTAKEDFLKNYDASWGNNRRLDVSEVALADFEKWVNSSKRKTKPFAEYKSVRRTDILILSDEEAEALLSIMKANAVTAPLVEINGDNWNETFDTPIGVVKMGENQKAKLLDKGRADQYGMLMETLSNPDIILEENDREPNLLHERASSYLFVKTFRKEDGSKYIHYESVTVSQDGMEVSISSHMIRENQLRNKMKSDRLLYKATALDEPANSSAEQPVKRGGSLSSESKDSEKGGEKQEDKEGKHEFNIEQTTYTNKLNKTIDVFLVTFNRELTDAERSAMNEIANQYVERGSRKKKGWKDYRSGGYMMRSREFADELTRVLTDKRGETVKDNQPISSDDVNMLLGKEPKKKSPINRVNVESLMNMLKKDGDATLSENAEPVEKKKSDDATGENEKPKYKHSDEEMYALIKEMRDILGSDEDEDDSGIHFRDGDTLTKAEKDRLLIVAAGLTTMMFERGYIDFDKYCAQMVKVIGNRVRPWLKSFYSFARYSPDNAEYTLSPDDFVSGFDVVGFDNPTASVFIKADAVVEEQKAEKSAAESKESIIDKRNKLRNEREKQSRDSAAAVEEKAAAVASEAEAIAKDAAADPKQVNDAIGKIDAALDDIDESLALIGYYDVPNAESKAANEAAIIAYRLYRDLGIDTSILQNDFQLSSARFWGEGGMIYIRLPFSPNEIGEISVDMKMENNRYLPQNINVRRNYPKGYVIGGNTHVLLGSSTYGELLDNVKDLFKDILPQAKSDVPNNSNGQSKKGNKTPNKPVTGENQDLGGLFSTPLNVEDNTHKVKKPVLRETTELAGDSAEFQQRESQTAQLVDEIGAVITSRVEMLRLDAEVVKPLTMSDVKRLASKYPLLNGISDTDLQELVELAMTHITRAEAQKGITGNAEEQRASYDRIVNMYRLQPSLNARDSERLMKQQYSTPTPFGYVMGQFVRAYGKKIGSVLEPSAGNGALTIALDPETVHANDIDEARLVNLRKLGFRTVTAQNGLLPFKGEEVDAVMTNPPFGSVQEKEYEGVFRISSLEGQMAINALDSMKDDGRAAIIIGGNTNYRENGSMNPKDAAFFGYLYSRYNVVDVINISGKALYSRNGTGYDVRMILINGRKGGKFERVYPPVKSKARAEQVTTFDGLYKRIQDDLQQIQQVGYKAVDVQREPERPIDRGQSERDGKTTDRAVVGTSGGGKELGGTPVSDFEQPVRRNAGGRAGGLDNGNRGYAAGTDDVQRRTRRQSGQGESDKRVGNERGGDGGNDPVELSSRPGTNRERLAIKPGLTDEKVDYPSQSENGFTLLSVVPAAQAKVLQKSLAEIGDVDSFLVEQLGYSSKEELYGYLAAEQIDSVALAIHQMNKGNAFIIGDMTGVGKGRQGAALIRYAVKQGKVPIYFTQKSTLFTDNYRDLTDIGCKNLRPFIIASDDTEHSPYIKDAKGNVIYKLPKPKERKRVFDYIMKNGKLPAEYDYVITVYSQIQNGNKDYEPTENGWVSKPKEYGKKEKVPAGDFTGQERRDVIARLAEGNIVILDESHTVGGESGSGRYMQMVTSQAGGVTFMSATFAKKAANMPIYAQRTAISEAGIKPDELIGAIAKGGVTLQEIMSRQLVESGQMIRRERSFEGVNIDWLNVDDETNRKQRSQFNEVADIFNAIRSFQDEYIKPIIESMSEEVAERGATVGQRQGTKDLGVKNVPFASKMYNLVNQLLFALKVDAVSDRVIYNLKNGYKPVISFTNTMEGFLEEAPKGVKMDEVPNFSVTLMRALIGVMRYTENDADKNSTGGEISLSALSPEGQKTYNEIRAKIEALSADLPISPMDAIRAKIEDAGYSIAEITGRKLQLNKTADGKYIVEDRKDKDANKSMRDFNSGKLDVLMINKSGSTGISLHASSKFEDQRQRVMVFAQFQSDINDEVQMRGRIDRSGQVARGKYEYIMSTIPAEQRLQMMFKAKLKSLDANTTSSQKSKFNEMEIVDYLNKYGDEVVWEYMHEHPDLEELLGDPLEILKGNKEEESDKSSRRKEDKSKKEDCAGKISRYLAFLSVEEQDEIFREITEAYKIKMQLLDDAGENDLEITTMPLRAETKNVKLWHKGSSPDSGNAFADNTYVEEVECDVLKKPMKRGEIEEAQRKLMGSLYTEKNGAADWQHFVKEKNDEIGAFFIAKTDEAVAKLAKQGDARIAKLREKAVRDGEKARSRGDNNLTDEQIASLAETMAAAAMENEKQKQQRRREEIAAVRNRIGALMQRLVPGVIYVVPQDLKNSTADMFTQSYGTFVGFKFNKSYTLGSSTAVFATLDGRRKVELALNDKAIDTIIQATEIARRYSQKEIGSITMENWDSKVPTQTRQKRYIITGNLLQALVDTEKGSGTKGNLISFSTIDGEIRQGILMGENFKPSDLRSSATLSSRLAQIRDGKTVISEDGDVQISKIMIGWEHRGDYELRVPKSKQRGGKYTMNNALLNLVSLNNFVSKGGSMVAYVSPENIAKVVDLLSREPFSLTVLEESKLEDTESGNEQFREVEDIEAINERFNEELQQQIDGTLPKGHIYQLGKPGELLKACGFPDMPIELSATNLAEHSRKSHHIFEIGDIKGLVKELQNPIAAFAYGDKSKSQNVIVEIQKDGKNFLVGVHFNQAKNGIEVSSIRGIFPKNNSEWLNWIAQGKSIYLNKGKIQTLIDQQQKILADVEYLDLDSVAKIVKEFENPSVKAVKNTEEVQSDAENGDIHYRTVDAESELGKKLEAIPDEELVETYRNVQLFADDSMGSPMAYIDKETGEVRTIEGGKWDDSNPQKIRLTDEQIQKLVVLNENGYVIMYGKKSTVLPINKSLRFEKPKNGPAKLKYWLVKNENGDGMWADYNPYNHSIETPLNTQFSTAYKRPNLVVVKCLVPKSELENGSQADYANLPTGAHQWNNGRTLYLSRYSKIVGVLSRKEEARLIDEYWKKNPKKYKEGKKNTNYECFVPQVRRELEKLGYKFQYKGKWLTPEEALTLDEKFNPTDVIDNNVPFITDEDIVRVDAKISGKWTAETKQESDNKMAARVQEIADGLNTPVRIVQSEEEMAQLPTYRKRHAKGWFDTATGEVVIVVPNNENMADVENTVAHEVVAHKGLRKLVGDERFDSFLDEVYNNLDGKIKAVIDERVDAEMQRRAKEIADSKGGITLAWAEAYDAVNAQKEAIRREQTEEYMAELAGRIAESGFEKMSKEEQTVWGKVKERVMKFLDSVMSGLGIKTRLTDKELAYILYRSWKNLRDNGTLLDEAEDIDMRKKTGFNEKQQPNEPTDPNGGGGIRYRVSEMSAEEYEQKGIKSGIVKKARDIYENAVSKHKYKTIEAFQDSMRSLLEMYKAISGNPNLKEQDIASFENAYTAENEMSSKNKAEQHEFEVTLFRPLAAAIAKLTNGKKKAEIELNKYLIAKHGLERNEVLARRDAQRSAEEEFRAKKMLVERALKSDPDNEELQDELSELEREQREYAETLYSEYRQNDYSGLTSLMREAGEDKIDVPTAEQRAKEFVDGYETDNDTANLWKCINNCTKSTLKRLHTGGIISTDVYERTSKMFEYYIPLRGYDETTSDEVYSYLNDMDSMLRGNVMKTAKGRRSVADDPIATIAQMADAAIRQANRNEMKQKFLNFVQNNPSDAVSVNHLWLRKNEITNEWEPVFCNTLNPEDTPEEVAAKMEEFEERMNELASQKPEMYKKDKGKSKDGDNSVNIPYRVIGENINEHQVLVRRNGRTFVITINGNPRAAQALNGLTNPDVAQGGIYGAFEKSTSSVNRSLSAVYTTLNPNFMVSNFVRDMVYSNTMVAAKESAAYAATFAANCVKFNPFYMGKLFYLWENGKLNDSKYYHRVFKEFMRNGGETGFSQARKMEQYKSDVKKLVKREMSIRRKAGHILAMQNDIANRAMENTARFAAFITSRTFGRDVQRSVWDAKEVSVNFNKKGSGAKMYGSVGNTAADNAMALLSGAGRALFVFWNAGIQGMNNPAKVMGRNPIKGTAATMLYTALGFAVPAMIAAAAGDGGDDDDPNAYYNLPEHIRRQNICINAGDQWITVPLPIELRAFYGLGELAYEAMSGYTEYDDGELSLAISQQMTQLLPIDFLEGGGENPLMAFVPSTAKPIVEVVQNKSWTGLPIARENIWNENDPNWKKVYKNVNDAFLKTCKTLSNMTGGNEVSGGAIDINPEKVEYLLKGYTGGITQIATQMMNSYMTLVGDKDFDWRNVPIATRFVKNGDERTAYRKIQDDYSDYIKEYKKTEHLLKGYQEQVKGGVLEYAEKIDFLNNSPEYMRYAIISQYKPIIDRYNEAKKAARGEDTKKLLEAQEQAYIAECVNAIRRGDDMRIAMPQAEEEELDTKTLYNQIATYDDWNEDIQFRVRAGQAKQSGDEQAQKVINRTTARISKLKKQLGKGNDKDVIEAIRSIRRNTLQNLDGMQETTIEIKK